MADIRIKDLATTASSTAADDFLAVDGTTNGTRKLSAATPSFATSVTVPGVAGPTATDLTLAGGSTGASLVLGQGANANASVAPAGTGSLIVTKNSTGNNVPGIILKNGAAGYTELDLYSGVSDAVKLLFQASDVNSFAAVSVGTNHPLLFGINASEKMRIATTGNLLIGTTTDSGNGKLQLATHTTSAGGIGFGTDLSLYRGNTGLLILNDASAALDARIGLHNNGTQRGLFEAYNVGTAVYMGAASAGWGTIITSGNQVAALTLDSSQNLLTSSGAILYTNRVYNLTGGATPLAIGWTGSAAVLSIFSSGAATFAGAVTAGAVTASGPGTIGGVFNGAGSGSTNNVSIGTSGGGALFLQGYNAAFNAGQTLGINTVAGGAVNVGNSATITTINGTTPSTGAGSGALQVAGGIYAGAASYFGERATISGTGQILTLIKTSNSLPSILFTGAASDNFYIGHSALNTFSLILNSGTAALSITQAGAATFAGVVLTPSGSAAAPTHSFSGDADTGIYNPGGNQLAATCGGGQIWNTTGNGISMAAGKDIYVGNAYQAATVSPTGYITIKDSTGTTYKVCVLL